jgi:hypothetical protein
MAGFFDQILEDLVEEPHSGPSEVGYIPEEFQGLSVEPQVSVNAENQENTENAIDEQMSEAERRLSKALLYKQWVGGHLFDGDSTDLTREVEAEISSFVRERLGILLGVSKPLEKLVAVETQFTPIEVKVLKLLASKVLSNPKLQGLVDKVIQPSKPLPVKPTLRPRQQPEVAKPSVQPQVKPRIQPASTKVPAKVVSNANSNAKEILPQDQEIVEEKGKKFRIKWAQMGPSEFGDKVEDLLVALPAGRYIRLPRGPGGGLQVYKATETDYFKILRMDITPQVTSVNRIPFPTDMVTATAIHAGNSLATQSDFVKQLSGMEIRNSK